MADDRFVRTADRMAALQDARAAELATRVRTFVLPRGDERALDAGCGAGALALALAPLVMEVVGVDRVPELLELARERAPANAAFVEADVTALPFEDGSFDLAGTLRTLHHVYRPELVVAELGRVTRPGGRILVIDQIAPMDPLDAFAVDRFERARTRITTACCPRSTSATCSRRSISPSSGTAGRRAVARRLPRSGRLRGEAAPGPRPAPRARSSTPPPWAGTSWSADSPGGYGLQPVQRRCAEGDP